MRRLVLALVTVALLHACGGRSEERHEGAGGKGASGGKGGTGSTGGTGTGAEGSGTFTGGTGGGVATGGSSGNPGCCLAYPSCPPGEMEIPGPEACPPEFSTCHSVSLCCSTIWCASSGSCEALPTCNAGDEQVMGPCPPDLGCYSRSLCDSTIWCRALGATAGAPGVGGRPSAGGSPGFGGEGGAPSCDPEAEYNRNYVGTPERCQLIDYVCASPTVSFYNDCGCGCEQDETCPEVFQCAPGSMPPVACTPENRARCPFSAVLQ